VRGLRTKLQDLSKSVSLCSYSAIALTETWLSGDFSDAEIGLMNYVLYRCDRDYVNSQVKRGGGVLIAVRKDIPSRLLLANNDGGVEQLFVMIGTGASRCVVGNVYFPPRSNLETYLSYCDNVDWIIEEHCHIDNIVLLGDYNLPHVGWTSDNMSSMPIVGCNCLSYEMDAAEVLSGTIAVANLFQLNGVLNANNVALDLVFVSDKDCGICQASDFLLQCDGHHPPLLINIDFGNTFVPLSEAVSYRYDFGNADYVSLNSFLASLDWGNILYNVPLDEALRNFYNVIYKAIDSFVPIVRSHRSTFPVWFSGELKELVLSKKQAHLKYKCFKTLENYKTFSELRSKCKNLVRETYNNYILQVENSLPNNLKNFWNFVNVKRKSNELPNLMIYNGESSHDGGKIANMFADYFSSVYVSSKVTASKFNYKHIVEICDLTIDIADIFSELSTLNINKGPGPDGIPNVLLRHCCCSLTRPLHYLFNTSLSLGLFPEFWKVSYITPVFKAGDRSRVENYRPVSVLSAIPKIFESFVTEFMSDSFKNIIIQEQHGFKSGRSTLTNLLLYSDSLLRALEEGSQVDSIYTDFSKAFDRVNHGILCSKLQALGIEGSMLEWIRSYLMDRTQLVRVKGFVSRVIMVTSGVPQGSHLGPVLFNLFINDISDCFHSADFLLYADDLKIYRVVSSTLDAELLQSDLDSLCIWCAKNDINLNLEKCSLVRFFRKKNPFIYSYNLMNNVLPTVSEVKDLGVIFDQSLSFEPHIRSVLSRASKMLGFVFRTTSEFTNINSIRLLYVTLIRPILEYCSPVWCPHYDVYVNKIERVQKRFLRHIAYKIQYQRINGDYSFLMSLVNIDHLSTRRSYIDLKFLYNLLNGHVDCISLLSRINLHVPARLTRRNPLLSVPACRTNYTYHSYIPRVSRLCNTYCDVLDFVGVTYSAFCAQLHNCSL